MGIMTTVIMTTILPTVDRRRIIKDITGHRHLVMIITGRRHLVMTITSPILSIMETFTASAHRTTDHHMQVDPMAIIAISHLLPGLTAITAVAGMEDPIQEDAKQTT